MFGEIIVWVCLIVATIFLVEYCIWISKTDEEKTTMYPDSVSLPDGSMLSVTTYPKFKCFNGLPEKGICKGDLIICDPEVYPKIYLHDVVVYNGYIYNVDTCHKDGTYTLKRMEEKIERVDRIKINTVARYVITYPYDDVVDIVL